MNMYICYGCARVGAFGTKHLGLCLVCRIYKKITGHSPNRLGYEDKIEDLKK